VRSRFLLALGAILIAIGGYLAIRPLLGTGAPITSSRWLDAAFAVFFLIRGVMNVRAATRSPYRAARPDSHSAPPGR
jgi:hypothetical protein